MKDVGGAEGGEGSGSDQMVRDGKTVVEWVRKTWRMMDAPQVLGLGA